MLAFLQMMSKGCSSGSMTSAFSVKLRSYPIGHGLTPLDMCNGILSDCACVLAGVEANGSSNIQSLSAQGAELEGERESVFQHHDSSGGLAS